MAWRKNNVRRTGREFVRRGGNCFVRRREVEGVQLGGRTRIKEGGQEVRRTYGRECVRDGEWGREIKGG